MDLDTARAIEWDCMQLLNRFYGYLDEKRYDELAQLFVEDGAWNRLGKDLIGPDAIRAAMRERDEWLTVHVLTNVRIDIVDADHSNTTQYITLYRHEGWDETAGPAPVVLPLGILRHRDQLVRKDGVWKFQHKTSRAMMVNRERVTHYDQK
jgi:hypothetical protein